MISSEKTKFVNLIGIASTSICLIHCIAAPLIVMLGAGYFTQPFVTYIFLSVSFIAIFNITQKASNSKISLLLWVSFCGFLFCTLFQEQYEWLHFPGYLFASMIIIGHILNIKYCKSCKNEIA